ncbi:hypothetical protein L210DRAFT_3645162 [Boletus edulis BED1]|uniref:Uncharacterized protein n=1 Tax=Boletus edulis BED1 TaxID=1328754 RepID=A0AAD4GG90_BOLED|nr:hypothetical protein L210DRAFT_3645162 [Boletus edulis BED1]
MEARQEESDVEQEQRLAELANLPQELMIFAAYQTCPLQTALTALLKKFLQAGSKTFLECMLVLMDTVIEQLLLMCLRLGKHLKPDTRIPLNAIYLAMEFIIGFHDPTLDTWRIRPENIDLDLKGMEPFKLVHVQTLAVVSLPIQDFTFALPSPVDSWKKCSIEGDNMEIKEMRKELASRRTWEFLKVHTTLREQVWISQEFVLTLRSLRKWRVYLVGGRIFNVMQTIDEEHIFTGTERGRPVLCLKEIGHYHEHVKGLEELSCLAEVFIDKTFQHLHRAETSIGGF